MAWTINDNNKDVTGVKCVCDDNGNLTLMKQSYILEINYQRLLNVEFPWDKNSLNKSAGHGLRHSSRN